MQKVSWNLFLFLLAPQLAVSQRMEQGKSIIFPKAKAAFQKEKAPAHSTAQFYEQLYYPQKGPTLQQKQAMKIAWESLPADPSRKKRLSGWEFFGPDWIRNWGINSPGWDSINRKWTGRVTGVEFTTLLRASSANGGLYESQVVGLIPIWKSIGDSIPSLSIGAFASNPVNPQTIIAGTGEYSSTVMSTPANGNVGAIGTFGTEGIWMTKNGGQNWQKANAIPNADNVPFEEVAFFPGDTNQVYAVSFNGVFFSTNGGGDFQLIPLPASNYIPTDIAFSADAIHVIIAYVSAAGMPGPPAACAYYPNTLSSTPQFLTNDFIVMGKSPNGIKLSYAPSNPQIIYANCTYNGSPGNPAIDTNAVVFKSTQFGAPGTWTRCNAYYKTQQPALNYNFGNQGFRDNVIKVSPLDPNIVVMGSGVPFYCSDGQNFYETDGEHADQASLNWKPDGSRAFLGNDGGIFYSENGGISWNDALNFLPITQAYTVDVAPDNPNKVLCGTQDNGVLRYNGPGQFWEYAYGGDGGEAFFHPTRYDTVYAALGGTDYERYRSFAGGSEISWTRCETGISHFRGQFGSPLASDHFQSNYLYTAHDTIAYYSTDQGDNWTTLISANPLPVGIRKIVTSRGGNPHVYFIYLPSSSNFFHRLDVNGSPYTFNQVLDPTGIGYLRSMWADLPYQDVVYAAMSGVGWSNNRVYRSVNAGANWVEISGNLPSAMPPITDLWVNPSDTQNIVIATEFGSMRTIDGGVTWTRWDMGMPNRCLITDMDYCLSNGKMYVYASTMGRGIWRREASDADWPVGISSQEVRPKPGMECFPNPADHIMHLNLSGLPSEKHLIMIRDLSGKVINRQWINGPAVQRRAVPLSIENLASGMYLCELLSGENSIVRKFIKK